MTKQICRFGFRKLGAIAEITHRINSKDIEPDVFTTDREMYMNPIKNDDITSTIYAKNDLYFPGGRRRIFHNVATIML